MSVTVITEENESSESASQKPQDQGLSEQQLGMAVTFGQMTEANRQLTSELASLKAEYQTLQSSGEASRAELSALRAEMNTLINQLREEAEKEETEVTMVSAPEPEPKTPEEKPVKKRGFLDKLLYG